MLHFCLKCEIQSETIIYFHFRKVFTFLVSCTPSFTDCKIFPFAIVLKWWIFLYQAMTFHRCKYLKLQNLMVVDSQKMHLAFTNCMKVIVSNLKVVAPPASPNTDGIHISASRSVVVEDCIIRTGNCFISPCLLSINAIILTWEPTQ